MSITQETRREGLEHIEAKVSDIAAAVLRALRQLPDGATANEVQAVLPHISLNSVRSRLTELQDRNRVFACGKRINPSTGVNVAVWKVVEQQGRLPL